MYIYMKTEILCWGEKNTRETYTLKLNKIQKQIEGEELCDYRQWQTLSLHYHHQCLKISGNKGLPLRFQTSNHRQNGTDISLKHLPIFHIWDIAGSLLLSQEVILKANKIKYWPCSEMLRRIKSFFSVTYGVTYSALKCTRCYILTKNTGEPCLTPLEWIF